MTALQAGRLTALPARCARAVRRVRRSAAHRWRRRQAGARGRETLIPSPCWGWLVMQRAHGNGLTTVISSTQPKSGRR